MYQWTCLVSFSSVLVRSFFLALPVELTDRLANVLDTIPAPLLDRMEVLEVSGYVTEEKLQIADKYLSPQAKESSGLAKADVQLEQDAVDMLIKYYCRESGVRNLKKHIEKVHIHLPCCISANSLVDISQSCAQDRSGSRRRCSARAES